MMILRLDDDRVINLETVSTARRVEIEGKPFLNVYFIGHKEPVAFGGEDGISVWQALNRNAASDMEFKK